MWMHHLTCNLKTNKQFMIIEQQSNNVVAVLTFQCDSFTAIFVHTGIIPVTMVNLEMLSNSLIRRLVSYNELAKLHPRQSIKFDTKDPGFTRIFKYDISGSFSINCFCRNGS